MQQMGIGNQHVAGVFRNAHGQRQGDRDRQHQDHIETLHRLYSCFAEVAVGVAAALASSADR